MGGPKEKNIEKDFETALEFSKEHGPSILLLDEADFSQEMLAT